MLSSGRCLTAISACLRAGLPACLPSGCPPACPPSYLPACLPAVYLPACLPAVCLPACPPSGCPPVCLPACLPSGCLPACLPACRPACPPFRMPTCPPAFRLSVCPGVWAVGFSARLRECASRQPRKPPSAPKKKSTTRVRLHHEGVFHHEGAPPRGCFPTRVGVPPRGCSATRALSSEIWHQFLPKDIWSHEAAIRQN